MKLRTTSSNPLHLPLRPPHEPGARNQSSWETAGDVHWRERVGDSCYSSALWIEGHLDGVSKRGEVVVLAASKEFEELGSVDLGEKTFATPAIANGVMVLRAQSRLFSLGKEE